MKTNKWIAFLLMGGIVAFLTASCDLFDKTEDTSAVTFKLTDAPDTSGITNVKIKVAQIKVNESADAADGQGGSWKVLTLNPVKEVDLLQLANGVTETLGELQLTAGTQINQIRFVLDSGSEAAQVSLDGGASYINLDVPSKSVKATGAFQVPLTGGVNVVLDFDVSKSIIKKGNGQYTLKPAIRTIVENGAGKITGTAPAQAIVYAYKDGVYVDGTEPTVSSSTTETPAFPHAYSSTVVKADGSFTLAFLEADTYDLVLVQGSQVKFFDLNLEVESNKAKDAGALAF